MNSKLVPVRLASLVLALLYVLHALKDPSTYAHEGNGLPVTAEKVAFVQKEFFDDFPRVAAAATGRKMQLRGRKMVADDVLKKEGKNGETSRISGKETYASEGTLGRSQDHLKDQDNSPMMQPKKLESAASLGIPWGETVHFPMTKPHYFQVSKAVSTKGSLNSSMRSNKQVSQELHCDTTKNFKSERLLEVADDEKVDLLDYHPAPSKAPIHNRKLR